MSLQLPLQLLPANDNRVLMQQIEDIVTLRKVSKCTINGVIASKGFRKSASYPWFLKKFTSSRMHFPPFPGT